DPPVHAAKAWKFIGGCAVIATNLPLKYFFESRPPGFRTLNRKPEASLAAISLWNPLEAVTPISKVCPHSLLPEVRPEWLCESQPAVFRELVFPPVARPGLLLEPACRPQSSRRSQSSFLQFLFLASARASAPASLSP